MSGFIFLMVVDWIMTQQQEIKQGKMELHVKTRGQDLPMTYHSYHHATHTCKQKQDKTRQLNKFSARTG